MIKLEGLEDRVIEQIKKDLEHGDLSALHEVLQLLIKTDPCKNKTLENIKRRKNETILSNYVEEQ